MDAKIQAAMDTKIQAQTCFSGLRFFYSTPFWEAEFLGHTGEG
jgi:hypothetical protein